MTTSGFSLRDGIDLIGIGYHDLWLRYIAVGGNDTETAVRDHVQGSTCPDPLEHDFIAQAINEAFLERGQDHPVAYRHAAQDP